MTAFVTVLLVLERLFIWGCVYAFVGWVYESTLVSIQQRHWVDRGFLNGPLCPIYGAGAILDVVLFSWLKGHPVALFLGTALAASALEYATSWALERIFHARWWDYSQFRLNLHGRVCLLGAVVFGVLGVLIVEFAQPALMAATALIPLPVFHVVFVVCFTAIACDCAVTIAGTAGLQRQVEAFHDFVQEQAARAGDTMAWGRAAFEGKRREWAARSRDVTPRLRDLAERLLNGQQRRMIRSFPSLTTTRHAKVVETLREMLRHRRR